MQHLFLDESGTLAFGRGGTAFFVMAFVAPKSGKQLSKCIKNFNAHLIRNGWNPEVEIKASNLWHAAKNENIPARYAYRHRREEPMQFVLDRIAQLDLYIEYVVVKLDTIKPHLREVSNAILYNYFAWQLLKGPLCYFPEVSLYCDRRNREYHNLLKFDGYLEAQAALERAEKKKPALKLSIEHCYWRSPQEVSGAERAAAEFGVRGVGAADFVCWAIKSKFEDGKEGWLALIEKKVRWSQSLYFEPQNRKGS
ncbi:MAG: DUF3800 domain-containing protein [Acidobacteriia bacterium]|nr:DUF3800 domain-containing protein [Terriglobia bacterium]